MKMSKGTLFWGYIDLDGKIEVKKYINDRIIRNFEALPFVQGIFDPFYAADIWAARQMILARYQQELN